MQAYSCCNLSKCSWWLSHGPRTNLLTRKLVVGSDDTSPFGATKAYFRGEYFHVTHKKSEALEDGFSSPFQAVKKTSRLVISSRSGSIPGSPVLFFSLAFFFLELFWRPKNVKLGAASGKQRFGAWRWSWGRSFFRADVASGNRMKKHSRHYDSAWKNIGISGIKWPLFNRQLVFCWFLGVTKLMEI